MTCHEFRFHLKLSQNTHNTKCLFQRCNGLYTTLFSPNVSFRNRTRQRLQPSISYHFHTNNHFLCSNPINDVLAPPPSALPQFPNFKNTFPRKRPLKFLFPQLKHVATRLAQYASPIKYFKSALFSKQDNTKNAQVVGQGHPAFASIVLRSCPTFSNIFNKFLNKILPY